MNQIKTAKKSKTAPAVEPIVEIEDIQVGSPVVEPSAEMPGMDELLTAGIETPDLSIAIETVDKLAEAFGFEKIEANPPTAWDIAMDQHREINENLEKINQSANPPTAWEATDTGYPEPTVITIDENTDLSKIADMAQDFGAPKVRRVAIGVKMFLNEADFLAWQKEEPREIFEITPTSVTDGRIKMVIFVTYANGIIE